MTEFKNGDKVQVTNERYGRYLDRIYAGYLNGVHYCYCAWAMEYDGCPKVLYPWKYIWPADPVYEWKWLMQTDGDVWLTGLYYKTAEEAERTDAGKAIRRVDETKRRAR